MIEDLEYRISGLPLLGPVNLQIEPGTKTLIIGPNGAGKSLLLRICHGLLSPSKGRICWQGTESRNFRQHQSFVFQAPIMLNRSAAENVDYPLKVRGVSSVDRRELVSNALQSTGLSHLANRPAQKLSGGEKQKLALARSWVVEPEVLFLDEPTASLDPKSTRDVEELIGAIHKSGTKIIMTSHDFSQVRRLADEICFIHKGRVIEYGSAENILDRPENPLTRAYLEGELLI